MLTGELHAGVLAKTLNRMLGEKYYNSSFLNHDNMKQRGDMTLTFNKKSKHILFFCFTLQTLIHVCHKLISVPNYSSYCMLYTLHLK